VFVVSLLAPAAFAQRALWQVPSPPSDRYIGFLQPFVDYNGDGRRDMLQVCSLNFSSGQPSIVAVEVASGLDASILLQIIVPNIYTAFYVGDMTGDGQPEIALQRLGAATLDLQIMSLPSQAILWQRSGPISANFGYPVLGDLDVNGDGNKDVITMTSSGTNSQVFVYNHLGAQLYSIPISSAYGGIALCAAKLDDRDADGGDDFLVGVNDGNYGRVLLVSGRTGAILRTSFGLSPYDKTCDHVSNVGDMDADGVPDYAAFPWVTGQLSSVFFSGLTGQVIRSLPEAGNSVIAGEDIDQDGVPDLVIGADWQVTTSSPHVYGSTRAYSGRDGERLWEVDNLPLFSGPTGSNSGYGWMNFAVSLGTHPGSPYPVVAWYDWNWVQVGMNHGRIRGFRTDFAGNGAVTGASCSTTPQHPLIGVRQVTPTIPSTYPRHTRITVAKGPSGGAAWLNLDYATATSFAGVPLPIDLAAFGIPGCYVHVGPTASAFRTLGTTGIDRGYAHIELPRPLAAATLGTGLVGQWLLFDPTTLDFATTQKHEFKMQ
jgi:hypothetical protein